MKKNNYNRNKKKKIMNKKFYKIKNKTKYKK